MGFESVLSLLVSLLVAGLIFYAIYWFLGMLSLPQPIKNIVLFIVGIIGLIWLLRLLGVFI